VIERQDMTLYRFCSRTYVRFRSFIEKSFPINSRWQAASLPTSYCQRSLLTSFILEGSL